MKELGCISPFSYINSASESEYPICEDRMSGKKAINIYEKFAYDIDFSSETEVCLFRNIINPTMLFLSQ